MASHKFALTRAEVKQIRSMLDSSKRSVIMFDDDADGLASFLMVYRYLGQGKGIVVKKKPSLDVGFAKSVNDYGADLVIILDVPKVDQEFIDEVKAPVLFIGHHTLLDLKGVKEFNPRMKGDGHLPTSYLCYQVVQKPLWVAMVGLVGDWFLDPLEEEFREQYPDLLGKECDTPPKALFGSRIGELVKVFNFVLKGASREAMKYVKVLTRIEDPMEILDQSSSQGKYVFKKFQSVNREYEALLKDALSKGRKEKSKLLVFTYPSSRNAFTSELSNEVLYNFPDKVLIIARENNGEMKCSLRSGSKINIRLILEMALKEVGGYGGGHDQACGASIPKDEFERFTRLIRESL